MLRTGWVVVRRMTRMPPSPHSTVRVVLGDQHGDGPVLVGAAEGGLLPDDHDHAAARYLSWRTSNSASSHPCAVAVAAIDKAFTDQPSADVRRMRLGLAGSKGPSKTLAG